METRIFTPLHHGFPANVRPDSSAMVCNSFGGFILGKLNDVRSRQAVIHDANCFAAAGSIRPNIHFQILWAKPWPTWKLFWTTQGAVRSNPRWTPPLLHCPPAMPHNQPPFVKTYQPYPHVVLVTVLCWCFHLAKKPALKHVLNLSRLLGRFQQLSLHGRNVCITKACRVAKFYVVRMVLRASLPPSLPSRSSASCILSLPQTSAQTTRHDVAPS